MDIRFRCPHCRSRRIEIDEYSDSDNVRFICGDCLAEIKDSDISEHLDKTINKIIRTVKNRRNK